MSPLPVELGDGGDLRRLEVGDLDDIWSAVEAERERIGVWMPWVEGTKAIDDEREWLESAVHDERNLDANGIFVDGLFAGGAGRTYAYGIAGEVGYWIRSDFGGRGSGGFYDLVVYGSLQHEWPPR